MAAEPVATPLGGTLYLAPEGYEAELRVELGPDASLVVPGAGSSSRRGRRGRSRGRPTCGLTRCASRSTPRGTPRACCAGSARAGRSCRSPTSAVPRSSRSRCPRSRTSRSSSPRRRRPGPDPGRSSSLTSSSRPRAARARSPTASPASSRIADHPPSRAYLKLWEALTILGRRPGPGARAVDLGSSPGGWTWALERLGARVLSVDKAPLDPRVASLSRVKLLQKSAFSVDPASAGKVDWVVSDIVAYPRASSISRCAGSPRTRPRASSSRSSSRARPT